MKFDINSIRCNYNTFKYNYPLRCCLFVAMLPSALEFSDIFSVEVAVRVPLDLRKNERRP